MRWLAFHYGWFGLKRRSETPPCLGVRRLFAAFFRPRTLLIFLSAILTQFSSHAVGSRIKDLVMVAGARDNQLNGWGLVVGLAGDGDKDPVYTVQSMANVLQRFG